MVSIARPPAATAIAGIVVVTVIVVDKVKLVAVVGIGGLRWG
jgi:hypothetical protein